MEKLLKMHPDLVACILYITSRYVSGYQELREALTNIVTSFLRSVLLSTGTTTKEQEYINLQALMILYIFTRSGAVEKQSLLKDASEISFWTIKTTCEAFSMQIGLHRSTDELNSYLRTGSLRDRHHMSVRFYISWIWMFAASHQ